MYKTEVIKRYLSLSHKIFLTLHPLLGFRSSVGLEQQPSKLWVLGSNPSGITLCPMRVTKGRNFKLKERGLLHNVKSSFRV